MESTLHELKKLMLIIIIIIIIKIIIFIFILRKLTYRRI